MPNNQYVYQLLRRWGLSDFGARTAQFLVERPLRILLIIVVAMLVARIGSRAVDRSVRSVARRARVPIRAERSEQRMTTLAGALARLVRLVTAVVALFMILDVLGVNLAPLLAGAGVAGVALGLGAQSLVRDVLAGMFIIGEDQYGVGDIVDLGQASGVVEDLNLRSTRVRSADGTVWIVPNGQVQRVGNSSMEFTRAVVDVPLTYGVDLARVRRVVGEEAEALAGDAAWTNRLLDRPEVWGVQALDQTGPTMRLVVKTVPQARAPVVRELSQRIVDRLTGEGLRPPPGVAPAPEAGPPARSAPGGGVSGGAG
jgi:small conductance mechanosensitive channel